MAVTWDEAKRCVEEARRAAGHHIRDDAERADGQRRLDDEIRDHVDALGGGTR